MKRIGFLSACLCLAACSSGLNGEYSDPNGMMTYKFESGGKVYVSTLGSETELKYEVDDKKVKIEMGGANQILTLLDDGSLQGPLGIKLLKKK